MLDNMFIAEEGEVKGVDLFLPEPSEIFWSLVCLVILGVFFYKFVLPKINKSLELRSENIEGELANAAKLKQEAEKLHEEYSEEVKNAKLDAANIRDDARSQASQIISDARLKAQTETELIAKNARRAIEAERKSAEVALKKEINSLAMAATQKMLEKGVGNEERQSKFIDNALDKFEGKKHNYKSNSSKKGGKDLNSPAKSTAQSTRRDPSKPRVKRKISLTDIEMGNI